MLKNITMFHVKDHVSIPNRRKPMGNHKRSTSVHQFCKCFWISCSVCVSTLLVASSKIMISGSDAIARAMVSSWR